MRDGKPHLQTYWEESDPQKAIGSPMLSKLGVSLPKQNEDPVRQAWNTSTVVNQAAVKRRDENVEASIAAGLTPEASKYLEAHAVPKGQSLADYIYENGLDQMPRPREGWKNAGGSDDQRKDWLRAVDADGIFLEQAVEWIDAGFPFPWSGIPALMKAGVPAERAMEWEKDDNIARFSQRQIGGHLYLFEKELRSNLTLDEAREWRAAMSNNPGNPLDERDIEFRNLGFDPAAAGRWKNIMYYGTSPQMAFELKEMGWSPSSIKSTLNEMTRQGQSAKLGEEFAAELIRITPLVGGPKVVKGWIKVVNQSWDDGFDNPQAVKSVVESEAWKAHAKKVTGVAIDPKDHYKLASMLPKHRDAYLEVMNTEGRESDDRDYKVSRAMDLARTIASAENYHFLKAKGFPLGATDDGIVQASGHAGGGRGWDVFNAESASKEDQDRWLRSMATTMYWKNYSESPVSTEDRVKVIGNKDIDPVKLKDTLLSHRGAIKAVQLEGIVVADVSSAVAGGWL